MSQARQLRILHVAPMLAGSTSVQRFTALQRLGHDVAPITTVAGSEQSVRPSLSVRFRRRLLGRRDETNANSAILSAIDARTLDLLWVDKGLTIGAETLRRVRAGQPWCRIVGFSPDDMLNPGNQSKEFLLGLPVYDLYVTTKSCHVGELQALGCPRVLFIDNSYDPETHHPCSLTEQERADLGGSVGFIGQWEPERAESMRRLAEAGIPVRVWGYTWERMKAAPKDLVLENRPLWGEDYGKALCAFDINLCFLRKVNRDLQTTRSMEIPACGAFMLAERTDEHRRLFEEGVEAEFFSGDQELLTKVRHYLAHPKERAAIAQRGYERCLRSGYSYQERLRHVLAAVCFPEVETWNLPPEVVENWTREPREKPAVLVS